MKRKFVGNVDAEFGKNKKVVKMYVNKGKGIMVDEVEAFNRKKPLLPRPAGIVNREGGSMKKIAGVGSVNVGARAMGF
ncbi:hypothetical protein, partial [Salmonella enterica]|uniref:hypothetical protein n=1 Tax=Salmonella enterica TaxID=28901 RepID=UPI0020C464D5